MWKQVQSMIVKRIKRMRAARVAIQNGTTHRGNAYTRDNMAIPDIALPVVQVDVTYDNHARLRDGPMFPLNVEVISTSS
jgi:hypothetical protein